MLHQLPLHPLAFFLVLAASFAAGLIDAVVGGGGLITTPTLLLLLPGVPLAGILATTKCASIAGTAGAAAAYSRRVSIPWRIAIPGVSAALPAAWLGARSVSHLDPACVRPAILIVLSAMALYTWRQPRLGLEGRAGIPLGGQTWTAAGLGMVLGFYDGFLGPGTGSMLVLALIAWFGRDFLQASAVTKFINGASNLGALLWFAPAGLVLWSLALPMALCNLAGGLVGSRLAMRSGNGWVRKVFLAVAVALIARLAWALYGS
ncbi:MAG: sulfite exporter TauE/SafE family protein [Fibrobacteria bacterium]